MVSKRLVEMHLKDPDPMRLLSRAKEMPPLP